MKLIHLLLFTFAIFIAHTNGQNSEEDADDSEEKIVGGQDAAGRIRYQVSLQDQTNRHMCGGGLITPIWVLTSASCASRNPRIIAAGSNNLRSRLMRKFNITQTIIHRNSGRTTVNDIGMVKSQIRIVGITVGYLSLPEVDVGQFGRLMVSGWGLTSFPNGTYPNGLKSLRTRAISQRECSIRYNTTVARQILCTFRSAGRGICYGDTGSPVVRNNTVYGIASAMIPCGTGYPDFNVRVFDYSAWIANIVFRLS